MSNVTEFFMWGVSAKKDCGEFGSQNEKTYYGCSNKGLWADWYLNGRRIYEDTRLDGYFGEKIRKKIDTTHFKNNNIEVDLYLDCDEGIFRLCVVGMELNDDTEVEIVGLNNSGNKNGWVPNVIFSSKPSELTVRCCKIYSNEYYGKQLEIEWLS